MKPYNKLIIVSKPDEAFNTSKQVTLEYIADDCDEYLKDLVGKEIVVRMNGVEEIKKEDGKIFYLTRQESVLYSEPS